ncbi:NmrA/HSCARG family protein [Mycobacterium sp. ML4]
MAKKIIAVTGATGSQGGGLARAILDAQQSGAESGAQAAGKFEVRAITRNPDGAKARALGAAGAEVVAADMNDVASLTSAFTGAYGAYCVTDYWQHMDPAIEDAQIRAVAHAAKEARLSHVIWSTLEDTRLQIPLDDDRMPTLMGKYKVPHFDVKAEANKYFRDLGVPTTFQHPPAYWDNFLTMLAPTRGSDGRLALTLPMGDKKLAGIAAEDIGKCAYAVFQRGEEFIGKSIGIAGEQLTGAQMAAAMSRALREDVVYNAVTPDVFRSFDFPGADDIGNMFQYYADCEEEYCAFHDPEFTRSLSPEVQTFEQWLQENAAHIGRV